MITYKILSKCIAYINVKKNDSNIISYHIQCSIILLHLSINIALHTTIMFFCLQNTIVFSTVVFCFHQVHISVSKMSQKNVVLVTKHHDTQDTPLSHITRRRRTQASVASVSEQYFLSYNFINTLLN